MFGRLGTAFGRLGAAAVKPIPLVLPNPPANFLYLTSANGTFLTGADGAYLLGAA